MKKSNKKGFTIVELVIVIAVIAILAAVLIPTFASIVKKANLSADQQAVRQMNTILSAYSAENGVPKDSKAVKNALNEGLVNVEAGLVPVTQGYAFYWDSAKNEVVLVSSDDEIQSGWYILTSNDFGKVRESVKDASEFKAALNKSSNTEPALIKLTSNFTAEETIEAGAGKVATIDLNGKTLTFNENSRLNVVNGGSLTLKNGTVKFADGTGGLRAEFSGASLVLDGVKVEKGAGDSTCAIFVKGFADVSIVNSEITCKGNSAIGTNSNEDTSDGARISIKDTKIKQTSDCAPIMVSIKADLTIEGCEVQGVNHAMILHCGSANIKNTKFISTASSTSYTTPGQGSESPAAAVVLMAHGGAWGNDGNYTFDSKCTFTAGNGAPQAYLYSATADCKLIVKGLGNATTNSDGKGAGSIVLN